jgi:hypothetical protein
MNGLQLNYHRIAPLKIKFYIFVVVFLLFQRGGSGKIMSILPDLDQQYCKSHCILWCAGSAELCCCGERLYQSVLQEREAGEELPLQPAGRQQKPGQLTVHSTHAQDG